jgi:hypothetical protein
MRHAHAMGEGGHTESFTGEAGNSYQHRRVAVLEAKRKTANWAQEWFKVKTSAGASSSYRAGINVKRESASRVAAPQEIASSVLHDRTVPC